MMAAYRFAKNRRRLDTRPLDTEFQGPPIREKLRAAGLPSPDRESRHRTGTGFRRCRLSAQELPVRKHPHRGPQTF